MYKLEKGYANLDTYKQIVGVGLDLWLGGGGDFPSSNDIMHTIKVGWERAAFRRSKVFFLFARLNEAEVLCILEATKPHSMCDY